MKVVISGYGKMGHMVEAALRDRGIEPALATEDVCAIDPVLAAESVCIDFTTPEAFRANYPFLAAAFKAVVVGTTGWNDIAPDVFEAFEAAGTPMVWASNFSVGVNALFAAVEKVSRILAPAGGYKPSIKEIHHIHKLDAPSGTAKSLGLLVEDAFGAVPGIESERVGEVPGTHIVTYDSTVDRIVLSHEAFSREGFARGAVAAALMTEGLEGVHEFKDLIL